MHMLRRLQSSDRGASLVEYALMVGLIAVVSIGAITYLGDEAEATFLQAAGAIEAESSTSPPSGGESSGGESSGGESSGGESSGGESSGGESSGGESSGGESSGGESSGEDAGSSAPTASNFSSSSSSFQGQKKWRSDATVAIFGSDGQPLTGVNAGVEVRVTRFIREWDGTRSVQQWTHQPNLVDGTASVSDKDHEVGGAYQWTVESVHYEVIRVVYYHPQNPQIRWDGQKPLVQIDAPVR